MAFPGVSGPSHYFVPSMFSIPSVTWSSAPGGNSVGKFPNPRSVLRISKFSIWMQVVTTDICLQCRIGRGVKEREYCPLTLIPLRGVIPFPPPP